jgi:hypothetical protein
LNDTSFLKVESTRGPINDPLSVHSGTHRLERDCERERKREREGGREEIEGVGERGTDGDR